MINLPIVLCLFEFIVPLQSRVLFPYLTNTSIDDNYHIINYIKVKHKQSTSLAVNKSIQTLEDKWQPFRSMLVSIKKDILKGIQSLENSTDETNRLLFQGDDLSKKYKELKNKTEYSSRMRNRSFNFEQSQFQKFKKNIFHLKNRTNKEEIKAMTFKIPKYLKPSVEDAFEYGKTRADQTRDDFDYQDIPVGNYRYNSLRSFPMHPVQDELARGHPASRLEGKVPAIDDELEHVDVVLNRILNRRDKRSPSRFDPEREEKHMKFLLSRKPFITNVNTKKTWHDLKRVVTKSKAKDMKDIENELPDIGLKPIKLNKGIDFSLEPIRAGNRELVKKDKDLMTPHDVEMEKLFSQIHAAKGKLREETFIVNDDLAKLSYAQEQVGSDIKMFEESKKKDKKENENRIRKKQKEIDIKLKQIKEDFKNLEKIRNEEREKAKKLLTKSERKMLSRKETELQYYKLIAKVIEGFV